MQASDTFIDWLDIRQDHLKTHCLRQTGREFEPVPLFHGGVVARGMELVEDVSQDGNVYYLVRGDSKDAKGSGFRFKAGQHEGSHSTKVLVHSDGRLTRISGNVGRLDRPDNLFNYGFGDTVAIANRLARSKGLPEFANGQMFIRETVSADDHRKGVSPWYWSGAFVNELHITRNHYAGSDMLAVDAIRDMRGRRMARVSKAAYGDETVSFGMPNRKGQRLHRGVVVYRKGPEMLAHAKGDAEKARIKASPEYQLAMDTGIIRVELKCGALYLRGKNLRYLGDIDMAKLIALYNHETAPLLLARAENTVRIVDMMPRKLRMSALSWIDGRDMKSLLPRSTFTRHRRELLEYGLDISEPRTLGNGRPNSEEALQRMLDALPQHSLKPMAPPDWYGLPELERMVA